MTIDQLREIRSAYKECRQLKAKIAELELMRISPRATNYGGERVQTSVKGDIMADNIARMEELLSDYNTALARGLTLTHDFETAISHLNGRERQIMRMYYIDGMTWEQVCVEMDICWTRLHQIRRAAIDKIVGK